MGGVVAALMEHAFAHLFIECLGWNKRTGTLAVTWRNVTVDIRCVAEKQGFAILHCLATRAMLGNQLFLRAVQRQIWAKYREHLIIYSCETPRKQVWQWVIEQSNRPVRHRERPFNSDDPPMRLIERIEQLNVGTAAKSPRDGAEVLDRIRLALRPDPEWNLFAQNPIMGARGEPPVLAQNWDDPGARQTLVKRHIRLARKVSRVLIRWFDMDSKDAEQTAMIGLLQAARQFDPLRGYRFETYARYRIRLACQRYGLEWGLSIQVPNVFFWICYKLEFRETELIATYGHVEGQRRLRADLHDAGVSWQQWRHYQLARQFHRFSELDHIEQARLDPPEKRADEVLDVDDTTKSALAGAIDSLPPRLALILKCRYGIGHEPCSLRQIGEMFGLTKERIRQLQASAQEKLRRILKNDQRLREIFSFMEK